MNIVERYNLKTNNIKFDALFKTNIEDIDWDCLINSSVRSSVLSDASWHEVYTITFVFSFPRSNDSEVNRTDCYFKNLRGQGDMHVPIGQSYTRNWILLRNVRYELSSTTLGHMSNNYIYTVTISGDNL